MIKSRPALSIPEALSIDKQHIWHPYSSINAPLDNYLVDTCKGVRIKLKDGTELIDGMASWWSVIHGYNHPELNAAIHAQLEKTAHVMFGGLTHEPAIELAEKLINVSPDGLEHVFFSDSGSVSVEVAIKMAIQYWQSRKQPEKHRLLSLRRGYHGDTFAAMSVCDPETGMHHLFNEVLAKQLFTEAPQCKFEDEWRDEYIADIEIQLKTHHQSLAAVILEPIVQGAGGMRFYSPRYLQEVKKLCEHYQVLLIADEIATGFGRTGKMFACEHANISPDILCLGKALTGGYMTLAATLCSHEIAQTICAGEASCFMHGPTFMANPLACAVSNKSLELLFNNDWQAKVNNIETQLNSQLAQCRDLPNVADVRVLGAIGVVETLAPVEMAKIVPLFVEEGVWLRPFGNRVYVMPPYITTNAELFSLTEAMHKVLQKM
ncbi:adenosylmethionine-8-amino-7-oxononanoate aminotransferase [Alteromonadaceae bacterium Bs31]|nr:adenosylmethionine-8-amino-7-oxononanoate aminotransferase [Alteromonadaceae bacterium Bs31]